jgi:hypothetical protein
MKQFYLAHQFKYRHEIKIIQIELESEYNIKLINPFYDTGRNDVMKLDSGKKILRSIKECKELVDSDLTWIKNSDGMLCIIYDRDSLGAFMEIFYASKILGRPVYLVSPVESIRKHSWIRALSFKIFKSIEELELYFFENEMVK